MGRPYNAEVPLVEGGEHLEPETFGGCDDEGVGPSETKVDVLLNEIGGALQVGVRRRFRPIAPSGEGPEKVASALAPRCLPIR